MLDLLELKLQIIVSCHAVLGMEPMSSGRAASAILIAEPSLQPQVVRLCVKFHKDTSSKNSGGGGSGGQDRCQV